MERCETCYFVRPYRSDGSIALACCRHTPQPANGRVGFPAVRPDCWCGEYAPAPVDAAEVSEKGAGI